MPYTPNSTWVNGSGGGTPLSAARMNNLESGVTYTWDSYTPAWTSSGSAPAIVNGSLTGKYIQRGKWVTGFMRLLAGSSTTYGTGTYFLSLPVTAAAINISPLGAGYLVDASTSSLWTCVPVFQDTTKVAFYFTGVATFTVAATAPFTFASTDNLQAQFTYEAA